MVEILWARKHVLLFCITDYSYSILTLRLDVLSSNERRTWDTNMENWSAVQATSHFSRYLEEKEKTNMPNIVKDDLYVRKLSPVMPNPGNAFNQFLPKCWIPEDVNCKRIKRETYKPWYKEFQGFRFVFMHVSVVPVFIPCPDWVSPYVFCETQVNHTSPTETFIKLL